ncbi:MAG: hypothetical protein BHV77_20140 [Bacteroides sp. 43_108]|nr:MAG: hypothetical protein BHV77_20140 [Bacteroides sp. 43_108]
MVNAIVKSVILFCFIVSCSIAKAQVLTKAELEGAMTRALMLGQNKKYDEALELLNVISRSTEKQQTEEEKNIYLYSQIVACTFSFKAEDYKNSYLLARNVMQSNIADSVKANLYFKYAYSGCMYACDFIDRDNSANLQKARTILEEILPFANEMLKKYIEPKIPMTWYFEGCAYMIGQEYDSALVCMEQALQEYRKIGQVKDEINTLCNIAEIYYCKYDMQKALAEYQSAQILAEETDDKAKLLSILIKLETLNSILGDTEEEGRLALLMDSLVSVTDDAKVKFEYNIYRGDQAKSQGNLKLAELWYRKNDEYVRQTGNMMTSDRFVHYLRLRDLYIAVGDYKQALNFADLCVEEEHKLIKPNDADYYMSYHAIAGVYKLMGNKDKCVEALDSMSLILKMQLDPLKAYSYYTTSAMCYSMFKEYDKALAYYKEVDSLLAAKYPETDGNRIRLLPLIGGMEHKLGHYDESERLYTLYAERIKGLYGENNIEYINALNYQANAEAFAGHLDEACRDYIQSVAILKAELKNKLPYLTTAERDGFWSEISGMLINMAPFAIKADRNQTEFTQSCYDALILSKAFLLESDRSAFDVIKNSGNEKALETFSLIAAMRSRVKELEKDFEANSDSITEMSAKIDMLSKKLVSTCRDYGDITEFMDIDYDAVKDKLGTNDILIDFTDFVSESQGRKYAAFVINKKQKYPLLKLLFSESNIDSLYLKEPDCFYEEPYASKIRQILWKPLSEYVVEGSTVYYVPSQLLFQISLESIPLEDGSLLGDHYNFIRLSSARELMRYQASLNISKTKPTAVLYGGLDYDMDTKEMVEDAKEYKLPMTFALRGNLVRGDSVLISLPGSLQEVEAVAEILEKNNFDVTPYTKTDGTAESFVSMSGCAPDLLLLATHGFYYTPEEALHNEYLKGYRDAMFLSGLVLSGGNVAWLGRELPKGSLGGILTANDISMLDLNGLEMVVLSACKSGQGKATSEGLYGLQRAFKKAGAQTIVMTLWNVDDNVARDFMIKFYEELVDKKNKWNKRTAFERAKNYIRKLYPEAFYWAPFVMLD